MTASPPVSVVIPVRNEAGTIAAAIAAALAQEYQGDLEVVVADGMSSDGTRDIIASLAARDGRVRLVDNPMGRTPSGLNAAIDAASGTVIVRCDAHAVLPPGYVQRAVVQLEESEAANVGGIQRAVGTSTVQRAIALAMSSPLGVGDARFRYGGTPGPTDTVYLGVFRREALESVGKFDEDLARNQDYELNHRLRKAGHVVWFDPELVVDYTPRSTLGGLWRQYFDYGTGKRRMLRRHPRSLRLRQLAAPALIIGLVGSAAAAALGATAGAVVIPGAYAAALLAGTVYELFTDRSAAALVYPAAVATMHLSWGLGFLAESMGVAPGPDVR
jgi:succinoglycan biosynthesis protein ExoA